MDRLGVRELRQNLSVYQRRVADGETLQVTDHGHAVAVLGRSPSLLPSTCWWLRDVCARVGGGSSIFLLHPAREATPE